MRVAASWTPPPTAKRWPAVPAARPLRDVPDVRAGAAPDASSCHAGPVAAKHAGLALLSVGFEACASGKARRSYERFPRRLAVESLTPSGLICGDGFRVRARRSTLTRRAMSVVIASIFLVALDAADRPHRALDQLESRGPVFSSGAHRARRPTLRFFASSSRTMRPGRARAPTASGSATTRARVTRFGASYAATASTAPPVRNILKGDMSCRPRTGYGVQRRHLLAVIPFDTAATRYGPDYGWASAGRLLDVDRGGHAKALLRLSTSSTCRLRFDLGSVRTVNSCRRSARDEPRQPFPYRAPPLPEWGAAHVTSMEPFQCARYRLKNGCGHASCDERSSRWRKMSR